MFRIKISASIADFGQDLRRSLHTAMEIGAQGVQLDLRNHVRPAEYGETARRQLLNYLGERNLKAASVNFPLRGSLFEKERLEERLEAIRGAMLFASQLKIRTMTIRVGRLPAEDSPEYKDYVLPISRDLATFASHHGVVMCVIPAGDSADRLRSYLNAINTGPFAVDADLGSWVLSGRSPESELRSLYDLVNHVEIRDGVRDVDGIGEEVPIGRGEIDWDEIAGLLGEMEYDGWLNVRRMSGNDKIGDMQRAIKFLRNLIPME